MTVAELIARLKHYPSGALVALHDCAEAGTERELQSYELKPVKLYRTHPDRAPRLDNAHGQELRAVLQGTP